MPDIADVERKLRHALVENAILKLEGLGFASTLAAADATSRAVHSGAVPQPNGSVVMTSGSSLKHWIQDTLRIEAPHFFAANPDGNAARMTPAKPKPAAQPQDARARRDAATKALDAINSAPSDGKKEQ